MKAHVDVTGGHLWLVLWKAGRALAQWDERSIASLGLGLTDFLVLEALLHKGAQPVNELGRRVCLTSGSITTAVTRLQRRKLVARRSATHDARIVVVELTPPGRDLIRRLYAIHAGNLELLFDGVGAADRRNLLALMKSVGLRAEALLEARNEKPARRTGAARAPRTRG